MTHCGIQHGILLLTRRKQKPVTPRDFPRTDRYEILIIGTGPAGLSTALHLAQLAPDLVPRTLLLEKARHPRSKLCAGGLTIDAQAILQRLGLDPGEVPYAEVGAAHFEFAGQGPGLSHSNMPILRVVRREEFDAWLAAKARLRGFEILEGVLVKSVRPRREDVLVESTAGMFTAQVVVGADGSNGITRRCILPEARLPAARVLEVVTPPSRREPGHAFFEFSPVPQNVAGYVWDFPTRIAGESMRCWGVYDANLWGSSSRPSLRSMLAQEMAGQGLDLNRFEIQGHPIRCFHPFRPLSVPRVILVGDAAGADALLGEGISMALGYGALAAQALREAFARRDFSFRDYRRRVLFSPLGQTLCLRAAIAHFFYRLRWPMLQKVLWHILRSPLSVIASMFILNWGRRMRVRP